MADGIFGIGTHFGKTHVAFIRLENRVVSESVRTVWFGEDSAFHLSLECRFDSVKDKSDDCDKPCAAVGDALKIFLQK